jgi:hypothetical protein
LQLIFRKAQFTPPLGHLDPFTDPSTTSSERLDLAMGWTVAAPGGGRSQQRMVPGSFGLFLIRQIVYGGGHKATASVNLH